MSGGCVGKVVVSFGRCRTISLVASTWITTRAMRDSCDSDSKKSAGSKYVQIVTCHQRAILMSESSRKSRPVSGTSHSSPLSKTHLRNRHSPRLTQTTVLVLTSVSRATSTPLKTCPWVHSTCRMSTTVTPASNGNSHEKNTARVTGRSNTERSLKRNEQLSGRCVTTSTNSRRDWCKSTTLWLSKT